MYKQGTQRIEIIVKKEGGGDDTGAKETDADNVGGGKTSGASSSKLEFWLGGTTSKHIKKVARVNTTHAIAVAKQIIDTGIQNWINGIGQRNGDQALQEQVSRQVEIYKDVSGFASSVGMGIAYGSSGGVVGMGLGALFGAISSAVSISSKYANRERDFNYKVFKENNSIEYKRARASINLTTGRLR